jgi:hypothetical protein
MPEDCPMDMFDETPIMDEPRDFGFFGDIEDVEDELDELYHDCTIHDWNF